MGLKTLLGGSSRTGKLKMLTNLAISRIAILKKLHHVRCSQEQSDVIQLLQLGHQERALLRVEHVIKEQNMLDAFVIIENYCHRVGERCEVVKNSRECPEELREAISGLIFAASRCGEFPELQEIRGFFISKLGKEFVACAVELRNNCSIHPKMIQQLSTRQASLESRCKMLKQIAKDNRITLHQDHAYVDISSKDNHEDNQMQMQLLSNGSPDLMPLRLELFPQITSPEATITAETLSGSKRARKVYRNGATATQDTFESVGCTTTSAMDAVKLSKLDCEQ